MTSTVTTYLPSARWPQQVATREQINSVATGASGITEMVAAQNAPLRIVYGRDMIGAQIVQALAYSGRLILLVRWCRAPIEAIEAVYFDDAIMPSTAVATHYLGGAHSPNQTMVAAWAAQAKPRVYADAPPGTAYSVFAISPSAGAGFPRITAIIKGRKLYDDRTATTVWSDNPTLMLADFMRDTTGYGMGLTVDSASVIACANANDELVASEKRRTVGLTLDEPQECEAWLQAMRTYAGCMIERSGSSAKLVPDRPSATVGSLSSASGQIVAMSNLRKRGWQNVPTVVRVAYTDTSTIPWTERVAEAMDAGVGTGATPYRQQDIALPGIHRLGQATREAIERLNKLSLQDLSCDIEGFDDSIKYEVGDVIAITHPIGLTNKLMRVVGSDRNASRPVLHMVEYDPAVYSDVVVAEPTFSDTSLPSPAFPPKATGLAVVEESYLLQDGTRATRFRVTWATDYIYAREYHITLSRAGQTYETGVSTTQSWVSGSLLAPSGYTIAVQIASLIAIGDAETIPASAVGKALPPSDITSISAVEAGGEVRILVGPSYDIDLAGIEIRRTSVGGSWSGATFVDFLATASGVGGYALNKSIPEGVYDILACARDMTGQYSAVPARATLTVTSDERSFASSRLYSAGVASQSNAAVSYAAGNPSLTWFSADSTVANTRFPGAISTYPNIAATYHDSISSHILFAPVDFGTNITGIWSTDGRGWAINGSISTDVEISSNGTDYIAAGTGAIMSGRYARVRVSASGAATFADTAYRSVAVSAQTKTDSGENVSSASAGVLVWMGKAFSRLKSAIIQPYTTSGGASLTGVPDRILVAPWGGIVLQNTVASNGTSYLYQSISNGASRTIQPGDHLEYTFAIVETAAGTGDILIPGGVDISFTDATFARSFGMTDADGYQIHVGGSASICVPRARKISLSAVVGKTIQSIELVNEVDVAGFHKVVFSDIRITDGASTTRLNIYSTGVLAMNQNKMIANQASYACGEANSFLANVFNSATGARVASPFYWQIEGI